MVTMKRRLGALAVALGGTVLACQIVAGIERVDKADPPPAEAGPDVFVPDAAIADPCSHVRPPSRTGKDDAPTILKVDRIRDGRSFTTRTVVAVQDGEAIFSLTASFHKDEPGRQFATPIDSEIPTPEQADVPAPPTPPAESATGE